MVRKHLFILATTALIFTSCVKDDSTEGGDGVSVISLQTPLSSSYTLNQGDTLRINPAVLQSNGKQKLTYEQGISRKSVSNDPTLVYPTQSSGTYAGRLRLSNGQNIRIYEFRVNVECAYTKDVYPLAENNSKSTLSYVSTEDVNKSLHLDMLAPNNLNISFGTPRSMVWNKTIDGQVSNALIIAAGNSSILYQFDGYGMLSLFQIPAGEKAMQVAANSGPGTPKVITVTKNNSYSLGLNATNLISQTSRFTSAVDGSVIFANSMTPWRGNDLFYAHGDAYFDNAHGSLLAMATENTSVSVEILKGTFTDDTLVGMGNVNKQRNLALTTNQTNTGTFYFTYIFPGHYSSSTDKRTAVNVLYRAAMSPTSGIANGSVVRSACSKNIVYYTNGNAVCVYNVLVNSNFLTAALFAVGSSSEKIVDMVFSDDDNLIYAATDDIPVSIPGSLYCHDTQTNVLRRSKQHITGCIVKALFRNK